MKKRFIHILFFAALVGAFVACHTDDTCRKNRTVLLGANLYLDTIQHLTARLVVLPLTMDSLWAKGVGVDSLLYVKARTNAVKLPLHSFAGESAFRLVFNTIADTLTIKHTNQNEFLSLECGYVRTFRLDTVFSTGHFIDSISVTNASVNTLYVENIQLHHRK